MTAAPGDIAGEAQLAGADLHQLPAPAKPSERQRRLLIPACSAGCGLLIGTVSGLVGVPAALLLCAALCLLGVGGALLYRRTHSAKANFG